MSNCPCGSGLSYDACCGPYIEGTATPPTAEALMRSRYTAFSKFELGYLGTTLTEASKADYDSTDTESWARQAKWKKLDIVRTEAGLEDDSTGIVEFRAHFKAHGQDQVHHEVGHFEKVDGRWLYSHGDLNPGIKPVEQRRVTKVGRNDPCICGSGLKYKKCCGR